MQPTCQKPGLATRLLRRQRRYADNGDNDDADADADAADDDDDDDDDDGKIFGTQTSFI